ncbi:MAG TPA: cysteine hydrolase [Candidatus Saccharimonadales bacterium]|jgi:nicotinamidase-related amidase|nr:cysteine hydrolase [Candidatus Saccharimonadales bacterium]
MTTSNEAAAPNLEPLQEQRLHEILNPTHTALLVVDLQNDFLSPEGKSSAMWHQDINAMQATLPKIEAVTNLFYAKGRPVIRTRTYEDPELRTEAGRDRFLWFEGNDREGEVACLKGTWGSELYTPARDGDIVIEKERISAYVGTELPKVIAEQALKTLVVVGLKTQRCVARTVQDLYDNEPSLHVVVLEDCVASDNTALHDATMTELKMFYPPVISSEGFERVWQSYEDKTT